MTASTSSSVGMLIAGVSTGRIPRCSAMSFTFCPTPFACAVTRSAQISGPVTRSRESELGFAVAFLDIGDLCFQLRHAAIDVSGCHGGRPQQSSSRTASISASVVTVICEIASVGTPRCSRMRQKLRFWTISIAVTRRVSSNWDSREALFDLADAGLEIHHTAVQVCASLLPNIDSMMRRGCRRPPTSSRGRVCHVPDLPV